MDERDDEPTGLAWLSLRPTYPVEPVRLRLVDLDGREDDNE